MAKEQADMEHVNCALCQTDDYLPICSRGQFGLPANVVLCRRCGLMYLTPRWTVKRYLEFYQSEYDRYYRPVITAPEEEEGLENTICKRLKRSTFDNRSVSAILDVGSGAGENLIAIGKMFPDSDLHAIEPSDNSIAHLGANGVRVIARDIDEPWEAGYEGAFDLIVLRHVLEHLSDPVSSLQKLRSCLSTGGLIYVAVPNNMKPRGCLHDYWFRAVHTYYFGKETLEAILKKSGLEPLKTIEGDELSPHELFSFARVADRTRCVDIDESLFDRQLAVMTRKLKDENRLLSKFRRHSRALIRQLKVRIGV